jgi:teichuronic acid biosynthesis glycosyltransferase TuaH
MSILAAPVGRPAARRPSTGPFLPQMPPPTDRPPRPLIVVSSGVSWDAVMGPDRQFAQALCTDADILWVDPPRSPLTPARYRPMAAGRHVFLAPERRHVRPGLVRLTPIAPPGWTRPGVRSVTWPLVRAQIRWALRRLRRRPAVVIAGHLHDVLGRWGDDVVDVLYGTDDWVAGAELLGQARRRLRTEEQAALRRADLVLCVGPALAERWRRLGADPVIFPNGCDADTLRAVDDAPPAPLPRGFPTPVAGLVGQLNDRIDLRLLDAVAATGIGLLIVGPRVAHWAPPGAEELFARPNVHHVGAVAFDEVPRWYTRIDVGLTPYTDSPFNRASFPLKTLEYLAAGRPAVSSDLPASRMLEHATPHVCVAGDSESFAAAVLDRARLPRSPEVVRERRAVADRYSWASRADEFAALVGLGRETATGRR